MLLFRKPRCFVVFFLSLCLFHFERQAQMSFFGFRRGALYPRHMVYLKLNPLREGFPNPLDVFSGWNRRCCFIQLSEWHKSVWPACLWLSHRWWVFRITQLCIRRSWISLFIFYAAVPFNSQRKILGLLSVSEWKLSAKISHMIHKNRFVTFL